MLALLLHAHLPFVRDPTHARPLEERWLHEAIVESYLPLLAVLDRLARDEVTTALTVSLSPSLGDMLRDRLLRERFAAHLDGLEALAARERVRVAGNPALEEIVEAHRAWLSEARATWNAIEGDVVGALVAHARAGRLELMASAATHALLPGLLPTKTGVRAQVRLGKAAFRAQTGLDADGFWLPECAYDPALEPTLSEEGVRYVVLESHGLELARPRPPAGVYAPIAGEHGVVFFGRDPSSGRQVWAREAGYPGDPWYREHHRDIGFELPLEMLGDEVGPHGTRVSTGLRYHRVTGHDVTLEDKAHYEPSRAIARAREHAAHFVEQRTSQARELATAMEATPIIVAPYDAELFGHWWFEGPRFLEEVFRELARRPGDLAPTTLGGFLRTNGAVVRAEPSASTWGAEGHRSVWIDERNAFVWRRVHHAHAALERLSSSREPSREDRSDVERAALRQLAVETLLLSASDWPFILAMRTSEGYARDRLRRHSEDAASLVRALEHKTVDAGAVAAMAARDDLFEELGDTLVEAFASTAK